MYLEIPHIPNIQHQNFTMYLEIKEEKESKKQHFLNPNNNQPHFCSFPLGFIKKITQKKDLLIKKKDQ